MVQAATHGRVTTNVAQRRPSTTRTPKNHKSVTRFATAVARSIRGGQDAGQYLVVDGSMLALGPDIQVSPLGAVEKPGADPQFEIRLIHDLKGSSTNEAIDRTVLPSLTYVPVARLARRIDWLFDKSPHLEIRMMKGDVKGAFRHLMLHCSSVRWMGALIDTGKTLLIDLSAPFGWTSSPTYYGFFGGAILWLVRRESPASLDTDGADTECFFAYEWVNDHVLIEHNVGGRLRLAEAALRTNMMAVFGPRAMNERKFSDWKTQLEVLGLEFNLDDRTISMPERKIIKACDRLKALLPRARATRSDLLKLLSSLRHICTCCRAAKPFFQRIQALASAAPQYGTIALTPTVKQDLRWPLDLLHLGKFKDLPTTMFAEWPEPDIHLYMDASNSVLDPAHKRYIQVQFDQYEQALIADPAAIDGFTINVREQTSVAFAALVWGPAWRPRFQDGSRPGLGPRPGPRHREEALRDTLRLLQQNGMARSTIRQYESVWQQWVDWCEQFDWNPWLPRDQMAHSESLALFATYCWTKPPFGLGNAPKTVLSKISAISWRHRRDLGYTVGLHPGHLLALQGMHRVSRPPAAKAPATIPVLRAFRALCNLASAHDRVLWGAALVGFFFMLRSSEYLSVNGSVASTAITLADVTLRDARLIQARDPSNVATVELRIRGSKTDQEGNSVVLPLRRSGSGWLCPVLAVLDLLDHASSIGLSTGSLLCSVDQRRAVKASTMINKLKQAAVNCAIEPSRMGTHSLRSGGATAMMAAGVDQQVIKMFGRWASDSIDRYTRLSAAATRTLAAQMAAREPSP